MYRMCIGEKGLLNRNRIYQEKTFKRESFAKLGPFERSVTFQFQFIVVSKVARKFR